MNNFDGKNGRRYNTQNLSDLTKNIGKKFQFKSQYKG